MPEKFPNSDPAVAVLTERIANLTALFHEDRKAADDRFEKLGKQITEEMGLIKKDVKILNTFMFDIKTKFAFARGGYFVIAGFVAVFGWALGVFEKISKFFQ